ncbi:Beta_helix domain-containing protein [Chloropicon roscoffensis]|uniref:Beta_helix domain-containing protein n=1 Tax=Chloropicon roscoffensis TaxID=1461544 RepID=A0A7S3CF82_9CHLO|mmetsp:Transcript_57/g.195  ORF Transcript_57/g.195 Transcript_57/m.195 type:complete len:603 (+) Transcript_57:44-1852(+)
MAALSLREKLAARWAGRGEGPEVEDALRRGDVLGRETLEARRRAAGEAPRTKQQNEVHHDEEEEEELVYHEVWCSGKKEMEEPAVSDPNLVDLKDAARDAIQEGDYETAEELYTRGLALVNKVAGAEAEDKSAARDAAAVIYSNRSFARTKLRFWLEAVSDGYAAHELRPDWPKPYYRIAQAKSGQREYRGAIAACRQGQKTLDDAGSRSTEFSRLADSIAAEAFLAGSLAGFDGRLLHVRSAGEEAWLGREAPANPLIDGEGVEGAATNDDNMNAAVVAARKKGELIASGGGPLSFRSVEEALQEARDGDRVLLLRGIHNTGGATIFVDKRVLIRSEGTLEETTIDHRGNSPIFRLTRTCVLQNVDVDMTGFREALFVYGGPEVSPIVEHCRFRSSGGDAINVAGRASPLFRRCEVAGCKKVGLKLFGGAGGEYIDLRIRSCQQQALRMMEDSGAKFYGCEFTDNAEEGVVLMGNSQASLRGCRVVGNKGPAFDVSGSARIHCEGCKAEGNVGGLWLWESAKAAVHQCELSGGSSHAVLADGSSLPSITDSTVRGMVQATEEAWEGICGDTNHLVEPLESVELPPEEGPFKFEPVWYERKQ